MTLLVVVSAKALSLSGINLASPHPMHLSASASVRACCVHPLTLGRQTLPLAFSVRMHSGLWWGEEEEDMVLIHSLMSVRALG